jgi:hypothetical protein
MAITYCRTSTAGPLGGDVVESESAHHQCLENVNGEPLGGVVEEYGSTHHQRFEMLMAAP